MSDKKEKEVAQMPVVEVDREGFITRKLKAINEMPNKAMAKSLAQRVLRNKEVK